MIAAPARRPGTNGAAMPPAGRPTKHLCFDIETGNPSDQAIEVAEQYVQAAGNIKDPDKQRENIEKQRAAIRDKAALLDAAPIACMAFVTERERVLFYHTGAPWGKYKAPKRLKGLPDVELIGAGSERDMLINLRAWLAPRAVVERGPLEDRGTAREKQPSLLIGHNAKKFDNKHLRFAFVRHRLVAPAVLWPEARQGGVEVFDTMNSFLYDYSSWFDGDRYIKLEVVSALMGLPEYKSRLDGAQVPGFVAAGKFDEVATYNMLDALQTYRIFLGLANLGEDQQEAR